PEETPLPEFTAAPIDPPTEAAPLPETTAEAPSPETAVPPPAVLAPAPPVVEESVEETRPEEREAVETLSPEAAQTIVATFYNHVSNQSWQAARSLADGALAQQFDPGFFEQFQQVTVENVRVTAQTAGTVELLGQNTYVYGDGSTQQEERTYTVQLIDGEPRLVASNFVRVTKSR
ncbi:MAG: serine/threonine protein kinase, partial [Cyanobacteria bacterium P01_A01_bin.17]